MSKYKLEITNFVEKYLRKIPDKITNRIILAIESLTVNPYPANKF